MLKKTLNMNRVPLIVLMALVTGRLNNIFGCTLSDEDGAGMATNLMLRMGDIIGSRLPIVGEITGIFWIFSDISSGGQDLTSQMECYANKYLREYHMDRITITIKNLNIKFNDRKRDKTELLELLDEIEHVGVISSIQSNLENTQAAIYPSIAPWSVMHLAVYKQLISLSTSTRRGDPSQSTLKKNSDKWLLFYAQLMLRYHRAHKYKMILGTSMTWDSLKSSKIHKSPAELVKAWLKLALSSNTKTKLTKMIDSCQLTSGDTVQFKLAFETDREPYRHEVYITKYLEGDLFFSCWGSGSYCQPRNCPKDKILVSGSSYQYGWACRGETFDIYADQKTINHNTVVNIKYSTKEEEGIGYWVSGGEYVKGEYAMGFWNTQTRICPGKSFTHIKPGCKMENFKISELATSTDKGIYDGSFVGLGDKNGKIVYELYIDGSESSKKDVISAPVG